MIHRIKHAAAARFLPPRVYIQRTYRAKLGESVNLKNPVKFNEKLQWLKLNYRNPILTRMVDKAEAKNVVKERLGIDKSVPTAEIFDNAEQIRLDGMPRALALKATHGSGWNIISRDKGDLREQEVQSYFRYWLGKSYYLYSKEWAYKNVIPRVICEPLLIDEGGGLPKDYKIFCFGGEPRFIQVDCDRFTKHKRDFYNVSWQKQPFSFAYPSSNVDINAPALLGEMLNLAGKISSGLPFLRVDQYLIDGQVYIGELTAYPENGLGVFSDELWNRKFGELLELPSPTEI